MSLILNTIAFLLGGLGLFLLGMRFLSDGLQTIAGPSLKSLIGAVTNNRVLGVVVGVLVTCLVQSSAITTVMTIGFVNAEMMLLKQAIGVIMGANIGTTVTGWVLVLNIGKYGLPLAGICGLAFCFVKSERIKYSAYAILGVGLVFIGLEAMKDSLTPLAASEEVKSAFAMFAANSFFGIIKCVVIGCIVTALVQSSSATLGVTIAIACQGLISFETAAALILGQNVGSTITAFIASIGTSRAARRTALFHIIFNVVGVAWVILLFRPYLAGINFFLAHVMNIPSADAVVVQNGVNVRPHITTAIATYHTAFNLINLIVFLPFTGIIANLLERFYAQKSTHKKLIATKLDYPLLSSPFAAIAQSSREIVTMSSKVQGMLSDLRVCLNGGPDFKKRRDAIFADEDLLDSAQEEMTNFLSQLLSSRVSQSVTNDAEKQLRMCDDLESASDYVTQILKLDLRLRDNNLEYNKAHVDGLLTIHQMSENLMQYVLRFLATPHDTALLNDIRNEGAQITKRARELRSMHWSKLSQEQTDPLISTTYTDMLSSYRKIKEHLVLVAEAAA